MTAERARGPGGIADELRPYIDLPEVEAINRVGERLADARQDAPEEFRRDLRASLSARASLAGHDPARVRSAVAAYVASGLVLLAIAAIGLAGVGPLAG